MLRLVNMKKTLLISFLLLTFIVLSAQSKPIGSWSDHLPYQVGTSITTNGNLVYVGTKTGLFTYNTSDQSINRYSKVNLLNDVNIALLKYNNFNSTLVVVYENSNIDLIKDNHVFNIPFIKDKQGLGSKKINDINFNNETAVLSFAFGIVEINTNKKEISDTYLFGENGTEINVNSSARTQDAIYAGGVNNLYKANTTSNLLDYNSWKKIGQRNNSNFTKVFSFSNKIYTLIKGKTNESDSLFEINNNTLISIQAFTNETFIDLFISSNKLYIVTDINIKTYDGNLSLISSFPHSFYNIRGIVATTNNQIYLINTDQPLIQYSGTRITQTIKPNGPIGKDVFSIEAHEGTVWAVPGSYTATYNSSFNSGKIYRYENGVWSSYIHYSEPSLNGSFDFVNIKINPENKNDVYFGTFGSGMFQYNQQTPFIKYDENNSSLTQRQDVVWDWTGVAGIDFDEDNNLWLTNSYTSTCLKARVNGNWLSFDLSREVTKSTASTQLIITQSGHKWIVLPRDNAIVVYDDNGTYNNPSDDRYTKLTSEKGNGSIPGIVGLTIEEDKKGQIWVGTTDGIAVFYNPESVFETGKKDAQRVLIEGGENVEVLLAGTTIKDIAIDGANRKWIATEQSGVYLVSEDGTETIHHFTSENSPLYSNSVLTIGIDQESGEIYFGTTEGIISYKGTSTAGKEDFSKVKIFPNPVRESYKGPIAISGLMDNSTVKITDINGNLVNELRSIGGQAIWYGETFNGERASTGVYLIFNSAVNKDEELKTQIGKILFIN